MMATFFVVNTAVKLDSLTSRYLCRVRKETL
jgi:hypothetical protein